MGLLSSIPSLAGDGVAIALRSGIGAGGALLRYGLRGAHAYQAAFARRSALAVRLANALRHAAEVPDTRPLLMRLATVPAWRASLQGSHDSAKARAYFASTIPSAAALPFSGNALLR